MKIIQCELCMKVLNNYSDEFEVLGDIVKLMLDLVLLKLNFRENKNPVICKICKENLEKSFEFKSTCINTEGYLYPHMISSDGDKVDLKVVYFRERTIDKSFKFDENVEVCRFCLSLTKSSTATDLKSEILKFDQFFGNYMPELNLEGTVKAIICERCKISLEQYAKFVKFYLNNESKIIENEQKCATKNKESNYILADLLSLPNDQKCVSQDNQNKLIWNKVLPCPIENSDDNRIKMKRDLSESFALKPESVTVKTEEGEVNNEETPEKKFDVDYFLPISKLDNSDDYVEIEKIEIKSEPMSKSDTADGGINQQENTRLNSSEDTEINSITQEARSCNEKTEKISKACTKIQKHLNQQNTDKLIHKGVLEIEMFKCVICSYETKHRNYLRSHIKVHKNPSTMRMFKCELCSYETKWKCALNRHTIIHKDMFEMKMFHCDICNYHTIYKQYLKNHMILHKKPSDIRMYTCEICNKEIKCRNSKKHIASHKEILETEMFKCQFCAYKTKHKNALQSHMKNHKKPCDIIMYKCEICNYDTKWKSTLRRHMLYHKEVGEDRKFKCEICTYRTKQRIHLTLHTKIHEKHPI